jgi:hypothetical protein
MKTYIGTKVVNATPMNRYDYNTFRGWTLPADENWADEGYLVEYTDGGKPNTPQYQGYVSWSPKEQFDRAYAECADASALALELASSVATIRGAMAKDLDYAWAWHCNIAMAAFDAGCPHDVANEGAARFMELLASVDTRKHPAFEQTQRPDPTVVPEPDEQAVVKEFAFEQGLNGTTAYDIEKLVAAAPAPTVLVVGEDTGTID